MRVLQLHTPYRIAGGEDRVVMLEAEALRAAGHEVHQHVVPNPTKVAPTLGLLAQSPYNAGAARAAVERARAVDAEITHVHNTWFALSPSVPAALSRAGLPVVTTMHNYRALCISGTLFRDGHECTQCLGGRVLPGIVHGCYENRGLSVVASATQRMHRKLETWTEHTDMVIVPSETSRRIFVADGFDPDRLVVKDNFTGDPGPRPAPPSQSRTLLFVGRLRPEKGIGLLLEAWAASRHDGLELVVVGEDPHRAQLQASAPPGVTFTGALPSSEVAAAMQRARALVFPSVWQEPFGLTLVEAMAAGLPVVGFDVADTARIAGGGGLLVAPGDVPALACALDQLGDATVDRLGSAGRRRYEEHFGPAAQAPALEAVYGRALDVRQRRTAAPS